MSGDRAVIEAGIAHARQSLDQAEEALRDSDPFRVAVHLNGAAAAAINVATSAARLLEVEAYARAVSDVVEHLREWGELYTLDRLSALVVVEEIEKWAADRKAGT